MVLKSRNPCYSKDSRVVLPPLKASCNEPFRENGIATKIQKILKYHTMIAEYKKIEAPIDEITGMMLYAVYIRDNRFEEIHPTACVFML